MESEQGSAHQQHQMVLLKGVGVVEFKSELRRLKQEAIDNLARKMEELVEKADFTNADPFMATFHNNESRKSTKNPLPEKEFVMRNSVLTDLFTSRHIQTIENIVLAALVLWVMATGISDFFDKRTISAVFPSPALVESAFANGHIGLLIWAKMAMMAIAFYPITLFWSNRRNFPTMFLSKKNFDRLFACSYVVYQVYLAYLPFKTLFVEQTLGPATATAVATEQIRLMMKTHSFGREVWKKMKKHEIAVAKKTDGDETTAVPGVKFPGFSQYLYFLFAPTLVYRDAYPLTESIDWYYVFSNFAQIGACALFVYYLMARYLQPLFVNYPPKSLSFEIILKLAFSCTLPGTTILVVGFFAFQHSWLNAWAEMLRFGDRLFYKDWWNVSSFAEYYRTWNCVVHDWLYTYIYKDSHELLGCNKFLSACFVFVVSAICHEYIVIAMLKFFFPFLLLQLCVPAFLFALVKSKGRLASILLWASFAFGLGLVTSMYWVEFLARSQCPPVYKDFFHDAFIPRFMSCMNEKN